MSTDWTRFALCAMAGAFSIMFWLGVVCLFLALCGCGQSRDQQTEQRRNLKRETVEVRQEVHDGKVVKLVNKTVVVENETSEAQMQESIVVEQPEILGDLAGVVKTGVKALAGATMGPAAPAAVDWIWQTLAGVAGLGTAGGVGVVMRERNARLKVEQDKRLADDALNQAVAGVEHAKQLMSPAEVEILHNSLSKTMDVQAKARVRIAKAQV